jgi:putative flippase GtrA
MALLGSPATGSNQGAYVLFYTALRAFSPAAAANAFALVLTAVGNTAANRRLTFRVEGRDGLARHHAAGLISLAVALVITSASLGILDLVAPDRSRLVELAVLVAASAAATVARFVLLRVVIALLVAATSENQWLHAPRSGLAPFRATGRRRSDSRWASNRGRFGRAEPWVRVASVEPSATGRS